MITAGSGKTTTLAALAAHWNATTGPVVALAPSASAAHTLGNSLGVTAETTAKWLYETAGEGAAHRATSYDRFTRAITSDTDHYHRTRLEAARQVLLAQQDTWRFTPGQLVIIDEASLADTRTLATLTQQAQAARAKVLLVGDHLQRGAVDAGGAFGMLARRGPTAELTSLWRFAHPWEARASLELRRGHTNALDAYAAHGALHAGDLDGMLDAALIAAADARHAGRVAILQAVDTRTVNELNARIRVERILGGEVAREGGVTLHGGLTASVGDRVVTRRNNRHLRASDGAFVRNGSLWDVTAVLPDGGLLARTGGKATAADGDASGIVRLPRRYVAEHVELGYATTTARSQGITVDESLTIAAPGMGREDLYVAMSRGRHANRTYVVIDHHDDECLPTTGANPMASSGRDVLEQVLATSHAERSATETWADYHPDQPPPMPPLSRRDGTSLLRRPSGLRRSVATPSAARDGIGFGR